jgi:GNAT superfamily N-acetyltransferase
MLLSFRCVTHCTFKTLLSIDYLNKFMNEVQYREANCTDVPAMARIRAVEWQTEIFWQQRMLAYMNKEHRPQHALEKRVVFVASIYNEIIGFIAGHLTHRYNCDGELQWINVVHEYRGKGVSTGLLLVLAKWFITQNALTVCIDVDPENTTAQKFYRNHGAENLNAHWLYWKDISVIVNG